MQQKQYITVLVLRNQNYNFGGKLTKVGVGVRLLGAHNFNADFVKPTLYNIFSYILFNVFNWRYQTYSRKGSQNLLYFLCDCLGEGTYSGEYKIKPVLFLYAIGFVTTTKKLFKRKDNITFLLQPIKGEHNPLFQNI